MSPPITITTVGVFLCFVLLPCHRALAAPSDWFESVCSAWEKAGVFDSFSYEGTATREQLLVGTILADNGLELTPSKPGIVVSSSIWYARSKEFELLSNDSYTDVQIGDRHLRADPEIAILLNATRTRDIIRDSRTPFLRAPSAVERSIGIPETGGFTKLLENDGEVSWVKVDSDHWVASHSVLHQRSGGAHQVTWEATFEKFESWWLPVSIVAKTGANSAFRKYDIDWDVVEISGNAAPFIHRVSMTGYAESSDGKWLKNNIDVVDIDLDTLSAGDDSEQLQKASDFIRRITNAAEGLEVGPRSITVAPPKSRWPLLIALLIAFLSALGLVYIYRKGPRT